MNDDSRLKAVRSLGRDAVEANLLENLSSAYLDQGDFNHAIMIRSFLSHGHKLYYQAGAGVVAKSVEENELQEVNNKLAALRNAIEEAARIVN